MSLPTNRQHGDIVDPIDINAIAAEVNELSLGGTSGGGGEGGGVTDHGALTGLEDDDHKQYALTDGSRGAFASTTHNHDDRYFTEAEVTAALEGKAQAAHQHYAGDTVDLTEAVQDILNTTVVAGSNVTKTYDDAAGTLTLSSTGGTGGGSATTQPIVNVAGTTKTLLVGEAGAAVLRSSSSSMTTTVPANVFTAGQRVDVIRTGSGSMTFVAGVGMTLNGTPSLVLRAQWSAASVLFLSATSAVVVGDLATP